MKNPKKRWRVVTVVFGVQKREPKEFPFPVQLFYDKLVARLNEWGVGAGEVFVHPPAQIADTGTYRAVLMVLTDKEIPDLITAPKSL